MQSRFPVVNVVRSSGLGDFPTSTTMPSAGGPGTTAVSPWDLAILNKTLEPSTTMPISVDQVWSGEPAPAKPPRQMPPPPDLPVVSDVLENPEDPLNPRPRFITQDEADRAKNLTGLAVAGGTFAALVAAGLIAFR